MGKSPYLPTILAGISIDAGEYWRENGGGGWATAAVLLLLLCWQLFREFTRRHSSLRQRGGAGDDHSSPPPISHASSSNLCTRISRIITDDDLRDFLNDLEGKLHGRERWVGVIDQRNASIAYSASYCRPKDGPAKYLSITTFERCSTELLRDFYMDNEYRREWDKTVVDHKQLEADEASGIEVGRTIKKFPLLSPREYVLAWRVWEGRDKTFYCLIKNCEHHLALQQKKYVRVRYYRSGWRIRKVPGRDACEITMVHQEDNGMNVEMAKLAFAKGIWSYVCKMNSALRVYSPRDRSRSTSVMTLSKLIGKVPPTLEADTATTNQSPSESIRDNASGGEAIGSASDQSLGQNPSKKWVNGFMILGIFCLSQGRSTLCTQLAIACLLKKIMNHHGPTIDKMNPTLVAPSRR